jgi:lipopolysaccharide biosynthesis glycosyltransferase
MLFSLSFFLFPFSFWDGWTQVILMDADMVVRKPLDPIFNTNSQVAAVVDCCDKFNSGLMVLKPSLHTYKMMRALIHSIDSYDGGDQGFLNEYYKGKWAQLPYEYNAVQTTFPSGAWQLEDVAVLHLMQFKPWHPVPDSMEYLQPFFDLWWSFLGDADECFFPSGAP